MVREDRENSEILNQYRAFLQFSVVFGSPKGNTLGVREEAALLLYFCEHPITRRRDKSKR